MWDYFVCKTHYSDQQFKCYRIYWNIYLHHCASWNLSYYREVGFHCGEFRNAITISVIAVFFGILAFGNNINIASNSILSQLFNNFWAIVTTVIVFYFTSRVVDNKTNSNKNT